MKSIHHRIYAVSLGLSITVHQLTLLVLVTQTAGFVWTGGSGGTVDLGQLAILPAANAEQVAHHIALLLAVQLRHVFVRTHLEECYLTL